MTQRNEQARIKEKWQKEVQKLRDRNTIGEFIKAFKAVKSKRNVEKTESIMLTDLRKPFLNKEERKNQKKNQREKMTDKRSKNNRNPILLIGAPKVNKEIIGK